MVIQQSPEALAQAFQTTPAPQGEVAIPVPGGVVVFNNGSNQQLMILAIVAIVAIVVIGLYLMRK